MNQKNNYDQQEGINFYEVNKQLITFNIDYDCNDIIVQITYLTSNRLVIRRTMISGTIF